MSDRSERCAPHDCHASALLKSDRMFSDNKITFLEYQSLLSELAIGKKVNHSIYIHIECIELLPPKLTHLLNRLIEEREISTNFNIIKFYQSDFKITLLSYPDFFDDAHPALKNSIILDLKTGKLKTSDYSHHANPPILHRKELMLPPGHPKAPEFLSLTVAEEARGLYKNVHVIGFKKNWETLLSEKGLSYLGHKLVAERHATPPPTSSVETSAMKIDRHKTAIARTNFSRPIKTILEYGLLEETSTLLDFGCGQGDDVTALKKMGYTAYGWDPVFFPNETKSSRDIVNLGFVLNVIEDPLERIKTLKEAFALSKRLLVVSTLTANRAMPNAARPYKDGFLTSRNTFQKYYFQDELQQLIEDSLDTSAIAVGLGIFYVFRAPTAHQDFLSKRTKRSINWLDLSYKLFTTVREPKRSKLEILYESNKDLFDSFWSMMLELGRIPDASEYNQFQTFVETVGSPNRAKNLYIRKFGSDILAQASESRRNDLLVYLALSNFRKKVPFMHVPRSLQLDIKAFFGTYNYALSESREMLFQAGKPDVIAELADQTKFGFLDEQALYIHKNRMKDLCPVLRIYLGCAEILFGDLTVADIIKIHKRSGKISLLRYADFENSSTPVLIERSKINLRKQTIVQYSHSGDSPPSLLHNKQAYCE